MSPLDRLSPRQRDALREAVAYAQHRYDPWAILAAGTIVYGNPDENSDLDVYVLHDSPYRQRVQRRFRGVAAEIFVNTETSVLGYLKEEQAEGRLLTAHMLANGAIMTGEDDPRLQALIDRALESINSEPPWTEADLVQARYGAALLVEDALDRRAVDPESAMMLLGMAMESTLSFWFKQRRLFIPRHKDMLRIVEASDPELGRILRSFWGNTSLSDRWAAAISAADRTLETRGFFEWESEPAPVASSV